MAGLLFCCLLVPPKVAGSDSFPSLAVRPLRSPPFAAHVHHKIATLGADGSLLEYLSAVYANVSTITRHSIRQLLD